MVSIKLYCINCDKEKVNEWMDRLWEVKRKYWKTVNIGNRFIVFRSHCVCLRCGKESIVELCANETVDYYMQYGWRLLKDE